MGIDIWLFSLMSYTCSLKSTTEFQRSKDLKSCSSFSGVYELRFGRNQEFTLLARSVDVLRSSQTAKLLRSRRIEHMTLLSRRKGTCSTNHTKYRFLLPSWSILCLLLTLTSASSQIICGEFVRQGELVVNRTLLETFTNPARNLQQLVDCLQDQETLTFEGSSHHLQTLEIFNSITVRGSVKSSTSITCLDGPIFGVNATGVRISDLVINGCRLNSTDAPVMIRSGSTLELNSVKFINNKNEGGFAALRIETDSKLTVEDCSFSDNSGSWSTIHIIEGGTLTISNSVFISNRATIGGGAIGIVVRIRRVSSIQSEQRRTTLVINNGSRFEDNEALFGEGGAILANGNVSLTIEEDTIFKRNKAANQGGALFVKGSSTVRIQHAFFIENESDFIGGGAMCTESTENAELDVYISSTIFSKNAAKHQLGSGGAIRLQGPDVSCTIELGVSFISNVAELDGGAIHVSGGVGMNISEAFFIGNEAQHGGGAALFGLSSLYSGSNMRRLTLRIKCSMFALNRAVRGQRGGGTLGFASLGTEVHMERCRFDKNEAMFGYGGVFHLYDGPFLTVRHCAFMDNKAVRGGVMFGEKQARCSISDCAIHRNHAEDGGVASTRGAIDVDIINSDIRNNSARVDGGAIRAVNHIYDGEEKTRFLLKNSIVVNNFAGYEMHQGGFRSRITRGGGIVVTGAGQYVDIVNSTFRNNSASEGGAIAVIGPRQFLMTGQSHFEDNLANFGGALFILVDNEIDIWGDLYRVSDATFVKNTANSDGGAVWISSSPFANNLFRYNADKKTVFSRNCVFRRNRALNNGGGMMVTGVGLELQNVEFIKNSAVLDDGVAMSGLGGGLTAIDGTSIRISDSNIRDNVAYVSGGGLFVRDSSVVMFSSNFTCNRAREENGNGGAVALRLTSNRLIPDLETRPYPRPVLFGCNNCRFVGNEAQVYGGAIYHHHSDPSANYSETWNCETMNVTTFVQFRNALDFNSTCMRIINTADRLRDRHIRLARVQFIRNKAQSGAGLFTNHPDTIYVTDDKLNSVGTLLRQALNSSVLEDSGITFKDNIVSADGYGPNYASVPKHAYIVYENNTNRVLHLTRDDGRLGDFLRFSVAFQDAFGEIVTRFDDLTAELHADRTETPDSSLPVSGQTVGQIDNNGIIRFTGTRLQGNIGTNYRISLRFLYRGVIIQMNESLRIDITIRSCRIGQTLSTEPDSRRCADCGTGEFNADPMESPCQSCGYDEGRKCLGMVAIPEDHYWHVSSHEIKVYKCIGREACEFKNRFHRINLTEFEAHMNNTFVSHEHNNSYQCATGYHGILCGSCRPGYGREGESCRECASTGVRYLLFSMLILWSIGFVGYFVRSVLQVSKRIEFNKKFGRLPIGFPSKKGARDERLSNILPETNASTSGSSSTEIQLEEIDALSVDPHSSLNSVPTDAMYEQILSASQSTKPTQRDLARAMASEINRQRSSGASRRRIGSAYTPRRSNDRKQATLSTRFRRLKSNASTQSIEPLPLANPFSEVLKVLINFLQVTSVAVTINLRWSKAVRVSLLSIGSAANLSTGSGFFSLDCLLDSGSMPKSLKRMVMTTLFPAAVLLLFVVLWSIYTLTKKRPLKYFLQRSWLTSLAVAYFFYISITENLLRFFACVKIEEEDVTEFEGAKTNSTLNGYYWEEDTAVQCYRDQHALLVVVAVIPLLCLVTTGFPLGTLIILQLKAKHLEDEDVVGTYGFLYQAYNHHYWEIIIMLRKASIAAIVVFVYSLEANMQGLLCVLVLVVSLSLHLSFVPFREEMHRLNYLETCSLSTSIAVFVSGLMFNDRVTNKESEIFLSIFAILCVVGTLCLILFNLILSGEELLDMKLLELQVLDRDDLLDLGISTKSWRLFSHYVSTMQNNVFFKIRGNPSKRIPNQNTGTSIQMAESSFTQSV